jgi:hypothetical protein
VLALWVVVRPTDAGAQSPLPGLSDVVAGSTQPAPPAEPAAPVPPPSSATYSIAVLTMGPGDPFVTLFGHDALLVERAGFAPIVYNFGMYTEAAIAPHHVLGGTLRYFLEPAHLRRTLAMYKAQNRWVVKQSLDLEPAVAERLAGALSVNSLPENAGYHYDFALDNCTTRVRDALDRALGGALRRSLAGTARRTYRDHALRFSAHDWPLYFLFDLGLGRGVDRPISEWADAYLPDRLMEDLRNVRVAGPNGPRPLVSREQTLISAVRAPPRENKWLVVWQAAIATVFGAALAVCGANGGRGARWVLGAGAALVGLVTGLLGLWLLLMLGTKVHPMTHENFNVVVYPPLALWLVVPGIAVALGRASGPRRLTRAAGVVTATSAVGFAAATLAGQQSYRVALLALPLFIGVYLGALAAPRRSE